MDNVMVFLEQLAKELGVAVEYLWTVLVKQQYVEGVVNLALAGVSLLMIIVLGCCLPKLTTTCNNKYKDLERSRREHGTGYNGSHYTSSETEDTFNVLRFAVPIGGAIIIIVVLSCAVGNLKSGIQQLLNPDYFALKEILDAIS